MTFGGENPEFPAKIDASTSRVGSVKKSLGDVYKYRVEIKLGVRMRNSVMRLHSLRFVMPERAGVQEWGSRVSPF